MKVEEIMTRDVLTVRTDTPVGDVARILVEKDLTGVPVVDEAGRVVGLIEEKDLIVKDARLHFPSYITILDSIVYLGGTKHFEEELRKFLATTASEIMDQDPKVVTPESEISDLATLMVEEDANPVPVVKDHKLVGIVSRADLVKLLAREIENK
ncbi:MAG: CBS domain-containing protein [Dehalococcoidia bacterium]|nr:CBS domain-containing protein [Dehalococcoidia bacterium]